MTPFLKSFETGPIAFPSWKLSTILFGRTKRRGRSSVRSLVKNIDRTGIAIRLKSRNGAKSSLIFGRETKAQVAAPTQGSEGTKRNFTHSSPSTSKSRTPTGIIMGKIPNFNDSIKSIRAPPV
eukprot:Gb_01152 [translate_table: standard]